MFGRFLNPFLHVAATPYIPPPVNPSSDKPAEIDRRQATINGPHQSDTINILDDECEWCKSMRAGPCKRQFNIWQSCIKQVQADIDNPSSLPSTNAVINLANSQATNLSLADREKQKNKNYATICFDHFRRLHACINQSNKNKAYYKQFVKIVDDEEDSADFDGPDFDAMDFPDDDDEVA